MSWSRSKPSGLVVSRHSLGNNNSRLKQSHKQCNLLPSLEEILLEQGMELFSLNPDGSRGLVHRLDTGTSGCLIVAKFNSIHANLISLFFLRRVQTSYVALVWSQQDNVEPDELFSLTGSIHRNVNRQPTQSSSEILEQYRTHAAKIKMKTL